MGCQETSGDKKEKSNPGNNGWIRIPRGGGGNRGKMCGHVTTGEHEKKGMKLLVPRLELV